MGGRAESCRSKEKSDLDIAGPPIEVQVEVFDFSILFKLVCNVLFCRFLVDVCNHYDPSLDSWIRYFFQNRVWCNEGEERTSRCPGLSRGFHTVKLLIFSNSTLIPTCEVNEKDEKSACCTSIPTGALKPATLTADDA